MAHDATLDLLLPSRSRSSSRRLLEIKCEVDTGTKDYHGADPRRDISRSTRLSQSSHDVAMGTMKTR
ncbi:hypothetical protein LshimejAT787_2600210 [Lyophyllum shimeji]|uniref:Uncharacterized protein n=1 Tax=Lyophyllum shimeji TaxID=47721 RepID=A0A9P3Q127_LYOSH|nr:hypothetical protein LshimejAT787_2600210 [Lyophyllum shimeji]